MNGRITSNGWGMEEALLWLRWVESNRCENCLGSCIGHAVETDLLEVGLERAAANEHYRYALCVIARRLNGLRKTGSGSRRSFIRDSRAVL